MHITLSAIIIFRKKGQNPFKHFAEMTDHWKKYYFTGFQFNEKFIPVGRYFATSNPNVNIVASDCQIQFSGMTCPAICR